MEVRLCALHAEQEGIEPKAWASKTGRRGKIPRTGTPPLNDPLDLAQQNLGPFPEENPQPVLRISASGRLSYFNKPGEHIIASWGCARVGDALPDHVRAFVDNALSVGTLREVDVQVDDTTYRLQLAPAASGGYVSIYGSDVTAQREMATHVADVARFPEENPNPVLRVSRSGELLYANSASDPLISLWSASIGDSLPSELWSQIERAGDEPCRIDVDCGPVTYRMHVTPIADRDYVNIYAREISGQRIAEREVGKLLAEYRRSNDELARFASVVSHDLRAPLRAIRRLAEWVVDDGADTLSDESREHLDLIGERSAGMATLIDSLLEYARVGGEELSLDRVDLQELFNDVVDQLDVPAGMVIRGDIDAAPLTTSRVALRQVMQNLISNAVNHHDRDEGEICVTVRDEARCVRLTFRDDGPGIAAKHHKRVFRLFGTLNEKSSSSSGMGLAMVKKYVSLAGGDIALQSDGRGCTFTVTWPRRVKSGDTSR